MRKAELMGFFIVAVLLCGMGQIRLLEIDPTPGDEMEAHVNLVDVEDTRLTMYIPELGYWNSYGDFDGDVGKMIHYDIPEDVEPDYYLVRFRTESNGIGHSVYRHIWIG